MLFEYSLFEYLLFEYSLLLNLLVEKRGGGCALVVVEVGVFPVSTIDQLRHISGGGGGSEEYWSGGGIF